MPQFWYADEGKPPPKHPKIWKGLEILLYITVIALIVNFIMN